MLLVGSLMLGVYTIVEAANYGWGSRTRSASAAPAIALLAGFLARQATAANPLMPLRVFRSRDVSAANLIQMSLVAGLFGVFFLGALYLEHVLGADPIDQLGRDAERHHGDAECQRQERETDLDRVVAEHVLEVQRAQEEHAEQPGDQGHLDQVGRRDIPRAEHAQRHQRVGGRCLARPGSRPAARWPAPPKPSVCAEPQPNSCALTIA